LLADRQSQDSSLVDLLETAAYSDRFFQSNAFRRRQFRLAAFAIALPLTSNDSKELV
jgi:hypothetical protein